MAWSSSITTTEIRETIMNDFYTFIVTSTINASKTLYHTDTRYDETLQTLKSIKSKVDNAKIIFIDNSIQPLTDNQKEEIDYFTDVSIYYPPNLFLEFISSTGIKSGGEAYILYEAMKVTKEKNLIGKRVFKISGRYFLSDTFDISFYDDSELYGKYAFCQKNFTFGIDQPPESRVIFETRLISFCCTLFEEYFNIIPVMFQDMMLNVSNSNGLAEVSNYLHVPYDKVIPIEELHVEGWDAGYCLITEPNYNGPKPTTLTYFRQ